MKEASIIAKVGNTFEIRLDASATSGYEWKVLLQGNRIEIVKLLSESWEQKSPVIRGPAVQVFKFQALQSGVTRLKFEYTRSWEKNKIRRHSIYHVEISD